MFALAKVTICSQYSFNLLPGSAHIAMLSDNVTVIEHLGYNGASGPTHRRWNAIIDSTNGLAENETLLVYLGLWLVSPHTELYNRLPA